MNESKTQNLNLQNYLNPSFQIPIYSPRTSFNIIKESDEQLLIDLTLNFDPFTIQVLKSEFEERKNEMNKSDFIQVIKEQVSHWKPNLQNRQQKLIRCLDLLFKEIDINGNKLLEWEEFTNYIIDKANVISTLKSKNDVFEKYQKSKIQIQEKKFQQVAKCIYLKKLKWIAFFEHNQDIIHFADLKTGNILNDSLQVQVIEEKYSKQSLPFIKRRFAKRAMLLDIISITLNHDLYLVTSSNDGIVRFYIFKKQFIPCSENSIFDFQLQFNQAQVVLVWNTPNEILFLGDRTGTINFYDKRNEPQCQKLGISGQKKTLNKRHSSLISIAHSDCVTVLLPINKLQFLASASMDKTIILWDIIKNKKRREYKNYHKKAIVTLDYNEDLIILISGGIDHIIYIWNPYIDTPVYQITDHNTPILKCQFINDPLHMISMDQEGLVKIWNVKKLKNIYTFQVKTPNVHPDNFVVINNPLKVVFYGKKFVFYDYRVKENGQRIEENIGQYCKYIPELYIFVVPLINKVKIWNALTGDIKKIYSDLTQNEITAFEIDQLGKRFFIGDCEGKATIHNLFNGAFLKKLKGHSNEIKYMFHQRKTNVIVTMDVRLLVIVHSDEDLNVSKILKTFKLDQFQIYKMHMEYENNQLIGLTENFQILKLNVLSGKKNILFAEQVGQKSQNFCLIQNLYTSFIQYDKFHIALFCFSPLVLKSDIILNWNLNEYIINIDQQENSIQFKDLNSSLTSMQYSIYEDNSYLIVGDDRGYVHCLDISQLIIEIQKTVEQIDKKWVKDPQVKKSFLNYKWSYKAHYEQVTSLEIYSEENIVISCCAEKRVVILNLETGNQIEILRHNSKNINLKPIAYKELNTQAIYDLNMNRIDKKYIKFQNELKQLKDKFVEDQKKGIFYQIDKKLDLLKNNFEISDKQKDDYFDEFDPRYFIDNKFDKNLLDNNRSNEQWKLNLNFDKTLKQKNYLKKNFTKIQNNQDKKKKQQIQKCEILIQNIKETLTQTTQQHMYILEQRCLKSL